MVDADLPVSSKEMAENISKLILMDRILWNDNPLYKNGWFDGFHRLNPVATNSSMYMTGYETGRDFLESLSKEIL